MKQPTGHQAHHRSLVCALPLLLLALTANAQPALPDTATFGTRSQSLDLRPFCQVFVDKTTRMGLAEVQAQHHAGAFVPLHAMPPIAKYEASRQAYWLRFSVRNPSSDTLRPSFTLHGTDTFRVYTSALGLMSEGGHSNLTCTRCSERPLPSRISSSMLLLPGCSEVFWVRISHRYNLTPFQPVLLDPNYELRDFVRDKAGYYLANAFFFIFLFSILLIALLQYGFNRERVYLYYALYTTATFLFFWRSFETSDPLLYVAYRVPGFSGRAAYTFLNLSVAFTYLLFIEQLLSAPQQHPSIARLLRWGKILVGLFLLIDLLLIWHDWRLSWRLGPYFRGGFMVYCGFVLYRLFGLRTHTAVRYALIGTLLLVFFSLMNTLLSLTPYQHLQHWDTSLLVNQAGIVFESLYFFAAMGYRSRWLAAENLRLQLERAQAFEQERNRIASELHDDLGSGLSTIRFLSERALGKETDPQKRTQVEKISRSAAELVERMRDIIWAMNGYNDSLENLITYLRAYALDYFETHGIACQFALPDALPDVSMSGERRRNVLLAVKEALHNIVKHACADRVEVTVRLNGRLDIEIRDNGPARPSPAQLPGNGLRYMEKRMAAVGGSFQWEQTGAGVRVGFGVPLG